MRFDHERLGWDRPPAPGLLGKIITFALGVMLVVVGFMLSMLVFASVAAIALMVFAYLWWKTRALRKQMRENPPPGYVIEGEARREHEGEDPNRR